MEGEHDYCDHSHCAVERLNTGPGKEASEMKWALIYKPPSVTKKYLLRMLMVVTPNNQKYSQYFSNNGSDAAFGVYKKGNENMSLHNTVNIY